MTNGLLLFYFTELVEFGWLKVYSSQLGLSIANFRYLMNLCEFIKYCFKPSQTPKSNNRIVE